jgi:hypothetical protein
MMCHIEILLGTDIISKLWIVASMKLDGSVMAEPLWVTGRTGQVSMIWGLLM